MTKEIRTDQKLLKPTVYGWGINDVKYSVCKNATVNGKTKRVWTCPYYSKWSDMIRRCFSRKLQENRPTYKGCTICEDWRYFSNFIKWVDSQPNKNWRNCEPDKDLLSGSSKHYSPSTVVFVSTLVNCFINANSKIRGDYLIGVYYRPKESLKNPYKVWCSNPFTGKQEYPGRFKTELEAHKAWQAKKHEYACQLADLQEDERVAKALRERYAPDKDWTKQ